MRAVATLALALATTACAPFDLPAIELDIATNCAVVRADVRVPGLVGPERPWKGIAAAAVDAPRQHRMWILAVQGDPANAYLTAIHLDETSAIDATVDLDVPAPRAGELSLIAGASPGEAWLVQSGVGLLRVWHLDARASPALVSRTDTLGYFPGQCDDDRDGQLEFCDTSQWLRTVIHLGGLPYLLALPPSSPDTALELWLAPLGDLAAQPAGQRMIVSAPCEDDPEFCEANALLQRFSALEVAGITRASSGGATHIAIRSEIETLGVPVDESDIAIASLLVSPAGTPAVVLRPGPELPQPDHKGARSVAADPWAIYVAYDPRGGDSEVARARFDDNDPLSVFMTTARGDKLIQLDDDIALAALEDGSWRITKVFPDAPERSTDTVFAGNSPITDVVNASGGSFVVGYADGTADLVEVTCDRD